MIVVFSRPGREALTAATVRALEDHGGAHHLPYDQKALFWVGETPPPAMLPWRAICFPQPPGGGPADFWLMLRTVPTDQDLIVFEDDVAPCRNAVRYIADRWVSPNFTSFFNPRGWPVGLRWLGDQGFACTQAIKIPAALAQRLASSDPSATHRPPRQDFDLCLSDLLRSWKEPVHYHRSIVQHQLGPRANGKPRAPLQAADFVGADFDALTLLADRQGGP